MDVLTLALHSALVMQTAALAPKDEHVPAPLGPAIRLVLPEPNPQVGPRLIPRPNLEPKKPAHR